MFNTYILIMAGGEGTRFAPLSTPDRPKQFLNFIGDKTFIQQTRERVRELVPAENVYVATNERYVALVKEQLPDVPPQNIIAEPLKKNTAPCIAYSSRLIHDRDPGACIVVLPSDHVILRPDKFVEAIRLGVRAARTGSLVTLGITPSWPATELGYIKCCMPILGTRDKGQGIRDRGQEVPDPWSPVSGSPKVCPAEAFVEKPDAETARRYLCEGGFYWNSGIFIWTAASILFEIATHLPKMQKLFCDFSPSDEYRHKFFDAAEAISIDYAVLEKTRNISVVPCDLGWSDVGTWEGLCRLHEETNIAIAPDVMEMMKRMLG